MITKKPIPGQFSIPFIVPSKDMIESSQKTVDTDVLVLVTAAFHSLHMLRELWIDFGVNKHHQYSSTHEITEALGKKKEALPFFHAFTGCDTLSFSNGIGKKKTWETSKVLPSLSKTFQELANFSDLLSFAMHEVERFVVILYSRTSECKFVKEARNKIFVSGRQIENIPPSTRCINPNIRKEQYIKEYTFGIEHLCHNMMYPVLLHGDGREKKMNRVFQFGQIFQMHPDRARNSPNAAAEDLVDLLQMLPRTELCLLRDMLQELSNKNSENWLNRNETYSIH